jgi:hypothetical protein
MKPLPPLTKRERNWRVPLFVAGLSQHLRRLRLDLSDIGGDGSLRDTIGIRDSLIHAADEPGIGQVVQEHKRLETIVERVLLALLNWRGPTNTPTLQNRPVLAGCSES